MDTKPLTDNLYSGVDQDPSYLGLFHGSIWGDLSRFETIWVDLRRFEICKKNRFFYRFGERLSNRPLKRFPVNSLTRYGRAQQESASNPMFSTAIFLRFYQFFVCQIWLPMALLPVNFSFICIFCWKSMKLNKIALIHWKFAKTISGGQLIFQKKLKYMSKKPSFYL